MMIQFLLKVLFVVCCFLFVDFADAQAPCSTQPPIEARTVYDDPLTQTNILCNNSILTLMTTNLTDCPNCTFLWSDGTTGQYAFVAVPGVYSVTVTDNAPGGCVGVSSDLTITAANLPAPTIAGDSFNVCWDYAGNVISLASLEVSNPCPTCSYLWYNLGGPVLSTFNDTLAPDLSIFFPNLAFTSNDAIIYLAYNFNNPISDDYYVQVTDSLTGCQMNSEVIEVETRIVNKPPLLSTSSIICDSNIAVLSTIDCQGCSYEWYFEDALIFGADTSFLDVDTIGEYKTFVTYENGCSMISDSIIIDSLVFTPLIRATMPSVVPVTYTSGVSYLCLGSTVELSMDSVFTVPPPWTYQWSRNGIDIPGATGFNYSASSAGLYRVFVIDENGCSNFSNTIQVISSTNGSGPAINATTLLLCGAGDTSTLSTTLYTDCNYTWKSELELTLSPPTLANNVYGVSGNGAGGYFVEVEDTLSGCTYASEIVLLKDTIYPAPSISTNSITVCSSTPIVFNSSILCAGCDYNFIQTLNETGITDTIPSVQSNYQTDSSGLYQLYITYSNGCVSQTSNTVQATFSTVNAVIQSPTLSSICNGQTVDITALPDSASCFNCSYVFLRDGVAMQPTAGLPEDQQRLSIGGDYQVVVSNNDGCADTSSIEVFQDITLATSISTSAKLICGPGSSVTMDVDTCTSCTYQWYNGSGASASSIGGATTNSHTISSYGAEGTYSITVTNSGCQVTDSIFIDRTAQPLEIHITIDSTVNSFPTICNGSSVYLEDTCQGCISGNQYQYQWFFDNDTIVGASFESFQVDSAGDYYVSIVDTNNCVAQSNSVTIQEFTSVPGFDLDFSGLGVAIPITYGTFSMNDHLSPPSVHSIGTFTSQTAGAAIAADSITASVAGSGYHFITYSYIESNANGSCSFSDTDTLEILGAVDMDIVNMEPLAPAFEACLQDTLQVFITNFTFEPDSVIFVAGGGNTITVPIISSAPFTTFAGVFSGDFFVVVPDGARTGKLTVTDGTSMFESENFFLVQNPSVTIDLISTTQPICSDLDTAVFSGLPAGGYFSAHYPGLDTSSNPELMSSDFLLLDSVAGYVSGVQNVVMMYHYTPGYTGVANSCPQIQDSITVEVRNAELDSVVYTPIAHCQVSEALSNLTFTPYPVSAKDFGNSYSGTYVIANTLLPSTIDTSGAYSGYEAITYEINNSGCTNSSEDSLEIWPTPAILDSIPDYLCSDGDTVFINRNADSLYVTYRGQVIFSDILYTYSQTVNASIGAPLDLHYVLYTESYNLMEVSSSNGGLDSIDFIPQDESYYFVASNVTGSSTTLSFTFKYERIANYFETPLNGSTALMSTDTVSYTIAQVSKNIIIENPSTVGINPAILADTIFCPVNENILFLGQPAGGAYFVNGNPLSNNIFNPYNFAMDSSYQLTYVYTGQACQDSASTGIYLPDSFEIDVLPNNGTGNYCITSPDDSILFQVLPPNPLHPIDSSSATFFIGGIQSSVVFAPSQMGLPADHNVRYLVYDIYGCASESSDTFSVFPIPDLEMTQLNPTYCLNEDTTQLHLYQRETIPPQTLNELTYTGIGYIQSDTATLTGAGIVNSSGGSLTNPDLPYFSPFIAGVGSHDLSYVYVDSNLCADSINVTVEIIPLPEVSLSTTGGALLEEFYCENDVVELFGTPVSTTVGKFGYGSDSLDLNGLPLANFNVPRSLDTTTNPVTFRPFIDGVFPGILQEVLYYYYEDNNGCRDTAFVLVNIRNFTTDPEITNLPDTTCASDVEITVSGLPSATSVPTLSLAAFGWFTTDYSTAFYPLDSSVTFTDQTTFYPDSAGVEYAGRNVVLTFNYTDTSRSCYNFVTDTVYINALPYLTLSTSSDQQNLQVPGSLILAPADTNDFYHYCETNLPVPIHVFDSTGIYPQTLFQPGGSIYFYAPTHLTSPVPGSYSLSKGIDSVLNQTTGDIDIRYDFDKAGPGLDTIRYTYTNAAGCTDSIDHILMIDSLPVLTFAGLNIPVTGTPDTFIYCETDPDPPLIIPAPLGVFWTLNFNAQDIVGVPFQLRPDTLAVTGTYMNYPLDYYYVGQQYADGGVCADSLSAIIQIRPAPVLNWLDTPSYFCMIDSLERIPISATPYGGVLTDQTFGVTAGIVADSLFVPSAQPGKRDLVYYYFDQGTGCDDTIQQRIYVYTKPKINFDINGGCSGSVVEFTATTAPFGMTYNSVAIDSFTQVIWDFGDGVIDTITHLPDTLVIPVDTHTYAGSGIFYPKLTVTNQGACDTTFTRRIIISPNATPTIAAPYEEFFDTPGGWLQEAADTSSIDGIVTDSLWEWGIAMGSNINTQNSGNLVWSTRLGILNTPGSATYKQGENAWVYSPCFDLTNLDRPMIELSIWRQSLNHVDGAVLQYHDNVSNSWKVLGETDRGINWYKDGFVVSSPGFQVGAPIGWTGSNNAWENARYRLDNVNSDLRSRTDVRFRIAFASDPYTLLGVNEGFAFDSVRIGNRARNVLVEHFSGTGYPGIETIEDTLYNTIFNNLYGRDVSLIQYHTDYDGPNDFYNFNTVDNSARTYYYGITDNNQVRVDGDTVVGRTSDLLNYPQLEALDIESLEDAKFDLAFQGFPALTINNSTLSATVVIKALQDLPAAEYTMHIVITEDSLQTITSHHTLAVMRDMLPDNAGYRYSQAWAIDQTDTVLINWPFNSSAHNISLLGVTVFVQNIQTKQVYQVRSTRDIIQFYGPVDSLDYINVEQIKDESGYEIITMKLFPNPADNMFNVEFDTELSEDHEWNLIDALGRVLQSGIAAKGTTLMQVSTDKLSTGTYIFNMKNEKVYSQRRVVVRKF